MLNAQKDRRGANKSLDLYLRLQTDNLTHFKMVGARAVLCWIQGLRANHLIVREITEMYEMYINNS